MMWTELVIAVVSTVSLFIVIVAIVYMKHKEKQTLIEKDMVSADLKYLYSGSPHRAAKWGFILIFGGVGLLIGLAVAEVTRNDGYPFAIVAIFVGAGLLTYFKKYGQPEGNGSQDKEETTD